MLFRSMTARGDAAVEAVLRRSAASDDAADMGAMSVVIIRQRAFLYHVQKSGDSMIKVFVGEAAGIQYGNTDSFATVTICIRPMNSDFGLIHKIIPAAFFCFYY